MKDLKTLVNMLTQLNYILSKRQKIRATGVFFIILIGALLEMVGISALLPFVQIMLSPEQMQGAWYIVFLKKIFGISDYFNLVIVLSFTVMLIFIIKNLIQILSAYLQCVYKSNLLKQLSMQMMQSYMNREFSFFVNTNSGEILRGVTTDSAGVHDIMETLFRFLAEVLTVVFIGGYLIYVDSFFAIAFILLGLICLIGIILASKRNVSKAGKSGQSADARNLKIATEIVSTIKDIYITQTKKKFLDKYSDSYDERVKASISYGVASSLPERIIETTSIVIIVELIIMRMSSGKSVEEIMPILAIFLAAAVKLMPSLSKIAGHITTFIYLRPTLEVAYKNIKEARSSKNIYADNVIDEEQIAISFNKAIELKEIEWRYSENGAMILKNLNLQIRKGEAIGIIGESGSGKSTLSDILLGLYKPQKGKVLIDGTSIYESPISWSKMIGYVSQNICLLDDSIRNNIIFGREVYTEEDVWTALRLANLDDYVRSLPEQLETIVGERGIKFSGGQRQRIAIARALYTNPDILILDEATSALDNETEKAVMEAIDSLQGNKTLLIIAHRLTTLHNCDKIYEIKDGQAFIKLKEEVMGITKS